MPLPSDFLTKFGPWAVVTGASAGMGAEFCRQIASTGISVALVARSSDRMQVLAKDLEENYAVSTKVIAADLSTTEGCRMVLSETEDLDIGLLVNCAGIELVGSFFHDPIETHQNVISVNITATTILTHAIGRRMADKGRGGILFVSTILAAPSPWFSTYSSSKAYVSTLSVVLKEELEPKGVTVTVIEPGAVKTDMFERTNERVDIASAGGVPQPVADCVREGLDALYARKARFITGFSNRASAFIMALLPEKWRIWILKSVMDKALKPEFKEYA